MHKFFKWIMFVILILTFFSWEPHSANSASIIEETTAPIQFNPMLSLSLDDDTDIPPCTALDMVILMDQSVSMFDQNDQNNQRFRAVETILSYLGNHAVWLCLDQNIQHRVTVVGYGDNPNQEQPNNQTSNLPDNLYTEDVQIYLKDVLIPSQRVIGEQLYELWKDEREVLKNDLSPFSEENGNELGATDHMSALLMAEEILEEWREDPINIDNNDRRQAIIILTDGEPCLFRRGCSNLPSGQIYDFRPDMQNISELTDPRGDDFPWYGPENNQSVYISLITLRRRTGGYERSFLTGWEEITGSHGGALLYPDTKGVFRATQDTNTDLSPIVTDILSPIVGSSLRKVACNSDIWIEPYSDNLIILYAFGLTTDIQNNPAQIHIQPDPINDPNKLIIINQGNPSSDEVDVTEHIQDGLNEFYVLSRPLPGLYQVTLQNNESDCESIVTIRSEETPVTFDLTHPTRTVYPAFDIPPASIAEKFRVVVNDVGPGGQETLLQEFSNYPLQINAIVTHEDGTYEKSYEFSKISDGIYESDEFINSPLSGNYSWVMTAKVNSPNPRTLETTIFTQTGSFKADEVISFGFDIKEPEANTRREINTVQPGGDQEPIAIPVTVVFEDAGGAVPIELILTDIDDLDSIFTAELYSGETLIEGPISLTFNPNTTNQFTGAFTNGSRNNISDPGEYEVRVTANWVNADGTESYGILTHVPAMTQTMQLFNQYEVRPLAMEIVPPPDSTLHRPGWRKTLAGELLPFSFHAIITDVLSNEQVTIASVLANPDEEMEGFVVPPDGNPRSVPLQTLANDNYQQFEGKDLGADINQEGDYRVRLDLSDVRLQSGYAWAIESVDADFTRKDTVLTTPRTWYIIVAICLFIIGAFFLIFIYVMTGGPTGRLEVIEYGNKRDAIVVLSLKSWPRVNKLSHKWLKDQGIKSMKARKGNTFEGKQSVSISIVHQDGLNDSVELEEGEEQGFVSDYEIKYVTRNSS